MMIDRAVRVYRVATVADSKKVGEDEGIRCAPLAGEGVGREGVTERRGEEQ